MTRFALVGNNLILILVAGGMISCSNAVPTVESLTTKTEPKGPTIVPATNPKSFFQINAGSTKQAALSGGYKGNLRIAQSVGSLQGTSSGGYKLRGNVTLQK